MSDLAPNGFPRAPRWSWFMRAAVFPGEGIDGGDKALLELTDQEIADAIDRYTARGVNFLQVAGFHARWMWLPILDQITELNRRITVAAHAAGMKVFEHHSSNGLWHEIEGTYRGWDPQTAVNHDIRTGLPLPKDKPKLICINHPDYQLHYDHYVLDLIEKTGVDGLMYDDVHFHRGQYGCGCTHCRAKFLDLYGYELPQPGAWPLDDYSSPIWRDWMNFRRRSAGDRIVALRRQLPEDFLLFSCMSAGVIGIDDVHHGGGSFEDFARGTNCLFSEGGALYCRNQMKWDRNLYTNWERLYVEKKYASGIAAHHQQPSLQMHYPGNPDDGWFAWALTKCLGQNLWRCDTNLYGSPRYGDEFAEWTPAHDYLRWEAEHEDLWRFCRPDAEVGLLYSLQSKLAAGADPQPHSEAFAGWAQTLQRAGIFFDVIIDDSLTSLKHLSRFQLLILPNALALSDQQVETLKAFVENGGQLIATHATGSCRENGEPRQELALGQWFGLHHDDKPPTRRSAMLLDHRRHTDPIFRELPARLPVPQMLPLSWSGETPELEAWAWLEKTRSSFEWPAVPAMLRRQLGQGTALYLMPLAGSLAYREGAYPIWHTAPHRERQIKEQTSDSYWQVVEPERTPEDGRWIYVDEHDPDYARLMVNSVRDLLPQTPRIAVHDLPAHLICELHRLAPSPTDTSDAGDRLLTFLNLTGMQPQPGDWLSAKPKPAYPPLTGECTIQLRDQKVRQAELYSPDLPDRLPLEISADGHQLTVPMATIQRVAFLRLSI